MIRRRFVVTMAVSCACGCMSPPDRGYLPAKIPALKSAVEQRDLSVAPQLVKDLESSDPAVRFYAIEGLQRLTGETFDYVYYDDRPQREAAVSKWKHWLSEQMSKLDKASS